jgi:SulP family sulfate permease
MVVFIEEKAKTALHAMVPASKWIPSYKRAFLLPDIIAGITVSTVAVPQGLAYAVLANLPPVWTLSASF